MERIWLRYTLSIDFELEAVEGSEQQYEFEQLLHQRVGRELAAQLPDDLVNRLAALEARMGHPHWTEWAVRTNRRADELAALDAPAAQAVTPAPLEAREVAAGDSAAPTNAPDVAENEGIVEIDARDVPDDI
jgi:hypothetical protein